MTDPIDPSRPHEETEPSEPGAGEGSGAPALDAAASEDGDLSAEHAAAIADSALLPAADAEEEPPRWSRFNRYDELDPSIVLAPAVFWDQQDEVHEHLYLWHYRGLAQGAKRGFWRNFEGRRRNPTVGQSWLPLNPFMELMDILELRDHQIISDERIEDLQSLRSINIDHTDVIVPWAVTEHMQDCVPQFTLRNIARLEKDDKVERGIRLEHEPSELAAASEEIDEARDPYIEPAQFPRSWSAPLFHDFAIFLHEIVHLCPWGAMPKGRRAKPAEDSPWHPSVSQASLTNELLDRSTKVYVFGHRGGPEVFLRERQKRVYTGKLIGPPKPIPESDEPMG